MRAFRVPLAAFCLVVATAGLAAAQPTLSASSTNVPPGTSVTLTVTGTAGHNFAVIASSVGSGFSYAGVALAVGTNVAIVATGLIGGGGTAVVGFTPPFAGSALDRFYVQAVTSTSAAFSPLQASAGLVLHNRDLIAPPGPKGSNAASANAALASGANYILATPPFVAESNATCLVTSSVQIDPVNAVPLGDDIAFMRNAVSRDGVNAQDLVYGQYIMSNGLITRQPAITRASVISVVAGQTVRFGAYLAGVSGNGVGASATCRRPTAAGEAPPAQRSPSCRSTLNVRGAPKCVPLNGLPKLSA